MKSCIVKAKYDWRIVALCLILSGCSSEYTGPPNIIVILADDLGWMDTSVYGSRFYETPSIDQLAANGVRFTRAYSASPLCSPTRASILTGLHPARLGMTSATGHLSEIITEPNLITPARADEPALTPQSITRLPNEHVTYAEKLKAAGYVTAFVGKWHLGHPPHMPEQQGFDVVVGGRAHPGPPPPGHFFAPWNIDTIAEQPPGTHIADAITDAAIEFIEGKSDEPFLLNLWYYDVHAPYQGKPGLIEKYQAKTDGEGQDSPTMGAMIENMDINIGRILSTVESLDLQQRTVVIFYSDNGGNMYDRVDGTTPTDNAPLRSGKGNNYEGGVRVPLIVSGSMGLNAEGTPLAPILKANVSSSLTSSVDLFNTILELARLTADANSDGQSIVPLLTGAPFEERPVFSHFPHYVYATDNRPNTSVILGNWKLYRFHHDGPQQQHRYELYNLDTDASERQNVAESEPDIVATLDLLIDEHLAATGATPLAPNPLFNQSS